MLCKTFIVPRLAYCIPILNHSKFRLNKCFCFHNMFIILTLDISTSAFTAVGRYRSSQTPLTVASTV